MKAVFLRGSVPAKNEHPEKILYDDICDCEDMWTHLFHGLLDALGATGELYYAGGSGRITINPPLVEKHVKSIKKHDPGFEPDLIFCRGGFSYYDGFIDRYPDAFVVYYGAGSRYLPPSMYRRYDLMLLDSEKQMAKAKQKNIKHLQRCPDGRANDTVLWVKPAAPLFKPVECEKTFDICFMANAAQYRIKRHHEFIDAFAGSGLRILHLGGKTRKLQEYAVEKGVDVVWGGWRPRKELPELISRCRLGVCCSTEADSCPRVVTEYLACGLPVLVDQGVQLWWDKYITENTGRACKTKHMASVAKEMLAAGTNDKALRTYWQDNLSMPAAVDALVKTIRKKMEVVV